MVRLFWREGGLGGRVVLVVHGGPDWDGSYLVDPVFRLPRRVLLPDLRGCGRSARGQPTAELTPDNAVADLVALLDDTGTEECDVLGFSYGGLLAQRLALAVPGRVGRLVIASSTVFPVSSAGGFRPDPALSGAAATRAAAFGQVDEQVFRPDARPEFRRRLGRVRFGGEWLAAVRAGTLPPALLPDAAPRLAALGLPILLLHGAHDTVFPVETARRAAREIPAATAVVLPGAGHHAHVDAPERWLATVRAFLDGEPAQ